VRGTGYGHSGPVGEILAALPTDATFHVTDCGYDDNGERCGCSDLPSKLRKIIQAAQAEALRDAAALLEFTADPPHVATWLRSRASEISTSPGQVAPQ
jgi:hypothetical protein